MLYVSPFKISRNRYKYLATTTRNHKTCCKKLEKAYLWNRIFLVFLYVLLTLNLGAISERRRQTCIQLKCIMTKISVSRDLIYSLWLRRHCYFCILTLILDWFNHYALLLFFHGLAPVSTPFLFFSFCAFTNF